MNTATRASVLLVPLVLAAGAAWLLRGPGTPSQAPVPGLPGTTAPGMPPAGTALPGSASPGADTARGNATAGAAQPAAARAPRLPSFDVVRLGARGTLVVAGRAEAGSEVGLREGTRELGRSRVDARGEWVILPEAALAPGAHELSLRSTLPDGREVEGADTVLVRVPDPAPAVAGTAPPPAGTGPAEASQPLVLVLPRNPGAAPRLLGNNTAPDGAPPGAVPPGGAAGGAAAGNTPTAGARTPLAVDVLDYDDSGTMRFSGAAPPGARLRLYADDVPLGEAQADSTGRWTLSPNPAPAEGRHTLRVDQLGRSGAVAARVAVPFQRDHLPPGALHDGQVVVQPGNNLWRLARAAYGQGIRYTVIFAANRAQIRDPGRIYPGQVLGVPSSPAAESRSR
ncbi:LysM peptidoglycan-binding domain-containing protein [Roseomonas elaeocarpi]|uniref:LysM peptidoglycan-binding domain-containing protein n=1 Tax=Roseomonas elaeocarpi TaxID=907779 RepID=A0ABV6JTY0_9PROT